MKRKSEKRSNSKRKFYPLSIMALSFILAGLLLIAGYLVGASLGYSEAISSFESAAKDRIL